jgi:hypothetical protein
MNYYFLKMFHLKSPFQSKYHKNKRLNELKIRNFIKLRKIILIKVPIYLFLDNLKYILNLIGVHILNF